MKEFFKNNAVNLCTLIISIIILFGVVFNIRLTQISFHSAQDYKVVMDQLDPVITSYDEYIKINPYDNFAYFMRGKAYYYSGNHEAALKDFLKYKKGGASHESLYRYIGNCYADTGRIKQALDTYTEGIAKFPKASSLYNNRSYVKCINGYDLQDALKDVNIALSIETFPAAYHTRAEIQRNLGFYQYAVSDAAKALESDPDMFYNYCEKGYSQMKLGQTTEGLENLRTCAQLSKENDDYKYEPLYNEYLK